MVTSLHRCAPTNLHFPVGTCCFSHQKLQLPLGWALECSDQQNVEVPSETSEPRPSKNWQITFFLLATLGHHPSNSATMLGEAQATERSHVNENWQATMNSPRWGPNHGQYQVTAMWACPLWCSSWTGFPGKCSPSHHQKEKWPKWYQATYTITRENKMACVLSY